MNRHFLLCVVLLLFLGCRKSLDQSTELQATLMVLNDALLPLPCHATAFSTAYAVSPRKVPPFNFSKTLYSDTRVKTLYMLSRTAPNDQFYPSYADELKGTFTYSTNAAKFTGTKQTWDYSGSTRKSAKKENVVYNFVFNSAGLCTSVSLNGFRILKLNYNNPGLPNTLSGMLLNLSPSQQNLPIAVTIDSRGNPIKISKPWTSYDPEVKYKYDYTHSGGRYNYQPSQYGVTYEYSLLEVMQWVPAGKNPRSGVSVSFIAENSQGSIYRRTQSQVYKNLKYDSKKNLVSYTYGDNVLQKTTWYCK